MDMLSQRIYTMKRSKFQIGSKKNIWKVNRVEMKAQVVTDIVPISIAHAPSLLHHNNVGITYGGTSNFKMELVRFVPLYFMAIL
jgi:hypothetical protein